jgi:4-carboxymuconolactone decarboxylase
MKDKLFETGLRTRKAVLGAEYVSKQIRQADDFSLPMQEVVTKTAWGLVWTRPGLSRKARSMINIAMLVALGKADELELHIAGALRNGVTRNEIREILIHTSMYCGFPAALGGFRVARDYFAKHGGRKPAAKNKTKRR